MNHVQKLADVYLDRPSIVTIGAFDGVHRGHQHLVRQQVALARQRNAAAVVLTFFPHPDVVIRGLRGPYYLTAPDERAALLSALGVDVVVTLPFDEALRRTRAADFVNQMVTHLHMQALWVGPDFALGYKREGNVAFLQARGQEQGFEVRVVDLKQTQREGETISSAAIREALRAGEVEKAARFLGRPYRVAGVVAKGARRGHAIGFPTANLDVWAEQLIPATGVYAGWAWVGARRVAAATNVGVRPTFEEDARQTVEAHLLDFTGELYDQNVAFDFVGRLRGEQRFDGIEALRQQIAKDVAQTRALLGVAARSE
ncbi:MAG: bifunctional riboflavin kinase/FAD synthetase [Anaerolineae bacterium]|nr:bifunctional riboflavin kinase/FAD synthetase [Anaerolineae bacterium]